MVLVTVGGREKHKIEKEEKKAHRNTKGKKIDLTVYACAFLYTTFCEVDKYLYQIL